MAGCVSDDVVDNVIVRRPRHRDRQEQEAPVKRVEVAQKTQGVKSSKKQNKKADVSASDTQEEEQAGKGCWSWLRKLFKKKKRGGKVGPSVECEAVEAQVSKADGKSKMASTSGTESNTEDKGAGEAAGDDGEGNGDGEGEGSGDGEGDNDNDDDDDDDDASHESITPTVSGDAHCKTFTNKVTMLSPIISPYRITRQPPSSRPTSREHPPVGSQLTSCPFYNQPRMTRQPPASRPTSREHPLMGSQLTSSPFYNQPPCVYSRHKDPWRGTLIPPIEKQHHPVSFHQQPNKLVSTWSRHMTCPQLPSLAVGIERSGRHTPNMDTLGASQWQRHSMETPRSGQGGRDKQTPSPGGSQKFRETSITRSKNHGEG